MAHIRLQSKKKIICPNCKGKNGHHHKNCPKLKETVSTKLWSKFLLNALKELEENLDRKWGFKETLEEVTDGSNPK